MLVRKETRIYFAIELSLRETLLRFVRAGAHDAKIVRSRDVKWRSVQYLRITLKKSEETNELLMIC